MCPHFVSKSRGNEGLKQGKVESFVLGLLRGEEGGGELTAKSVSLPDVSTPICKDTQS